MSHTMKVKLSQWEALMVEGLRKLGWTDDEIVERVNRGTDLPSDDSIYEFHFEELAAFAAREPETFESAVRQGYQIKYNTIGGIRSWIDVALGKEPEVCREPGLEAVTAELTTAEKERLAGVLSYGWTISPAAGGGRTADGAGHGASAGAGVYRIEPTRG
ncbi:hypothetical protein COLU111180_07065 [Cohnella lubricantis]|uniref:Uncharacterized protein n=1 Tax=Cohnella lubricantis TaxID=2163172 RepID=A0A841TH70_9BACL|nr:hypothetical protein [Cohnella lubricantis]MBB6678590.1 hypothetical protein [Cohnella lubricantis]MBP2119100.1 hypothetical protein [Cohnella lubricantis]